MEGTERKYAFDSDYYDALLFYCKARDSEAKVIATPLTCTKVIGTPRESFGPRQRIDKASFTTIQRQMTPRWIASY